MSTHVSKTENLKQQNPESFSEKINPTPAPSFNMFMSADVFSRGKLNGGEYEAYLILNSFASGSGVFFVSDKALKERYPHLKMRTFREACASLVKKGLIYKDQIPVKGERWGGSIRKGTTADTYFKYVEKLFREGKEEKAKEIQDYFQSFHRKGVAAKNRREVPAKNRRSIEVSKDTSNIVKKKGVDAPSPFLEKMINELRQRKFSSKQLKLAEAYIQADEKKLMEKKSPLPYIVKMIGKGWAQDALAHKLAEIAAGQLKQEKKKAQQEIVQQARDKVQEIKHWAKENEDLDITFSGGAWHILISVGSTRNLTWRVGFLELDALKNLDRVFDQLKRVRKRYHL